MLPKGVLDVLQVRFHPIGALAAQDGSGVFHIIEHEPRPRLRSSHFNNDSAVPKRIGDVSNQNKNLGAVGRKLDNFLSYRTRNTLTLAVTDVENRPHVRSSVSGQSFCFIKDQRGMFVSNGSKYLGRSDRREVAWIGDGKRH